MNDKVKERKHPIVEKLGAAVVPLLLAVVTAYCTDSTSPAVQNEATVEVTKFDVNPSLTCKCADPTTVPFTTKDCKHMYCKGNLTVHAVVVGKVTANRKGMGTIVCSYYDMANPNTYLMRKRRSFEPTAYRTHLRIEEEIPFYVARNIGLGTEIGVDCALIKEDPPLVQATGKITQRAQRFP
jgi:hypothetical protein